MVMVNKEGRIVLVNPQTEKLFQYSRDELIGQPIEMLVPDRYRISERKRAEEERAQLFAREEGARFEAEAANRAKG
jgi:PAS domain S-box-containing protein